MQKQITLLVVLCLSFTLTCLPDIAAASKARTSLTMRKNVLLLKVQRGSFTREIWSGPLLASLPSVDRDDSAAVEQALAYWLLAAALDLEVLNADRFADQPSSARELYWMRACKLCAESPFCRMNQLTWDPLTDTRLATGQIFRRRADNELFWNYERFDREGQVWKMWPALVFEDSGDFLLTCELGGEEKLRMSAVIAQRSHLLSRWYEQSTARGRGAFARKIRKTVLLPTDIIWTASGIRLGRSLVDNFSWIRKLVDAGPQTFVEIVTAVPLW